MWSGKTDVLISFIDAHRMKGKKIAVYTSTVNSRDGDKIKSRTGRSCVCERIPDAGLLRLLNNAAEGPVAYAIDEGQFPGEEIMPLVEMSSKRDSPITLYLAGLDLTSERKPFGFMGEAVLRANCLITCRAWCQRCGKPAPFTYSTILKEGDVRVGDGGYEPRCEECWGVS